MRHDKKFRMCGVLLICRTIDMIAFFTHSNFDLKIRHIQKPNKKRNYVAFEVCFRNAQKKEESSPNVCLLKIALSVHTK